MPIRVATTRPTSSSAPASPPSSPKRNIPRWVWVLGGLALLPAVAFTLSLVLTPRLETPAADADRLLPAADATRVEQATAKSAALAWPEQRLEGMEAKLLLLAVLEAVEERLAAQPGYTATLLKHERIRGKLEPEQTLHIKVRHEPFAIYLKFITPDAGKEVVYAEGRYENHVMAHGGKLTRLLMPRLKVPPDSALALASSRHPVTEAGLLNLTRKLIRFRKLDLEDHEAGTALETAIESDGQTYLKSIHTHHIQNPERPFAYVEVLYDPQTRIPVRFTGYEWPESGVWNGERILGEQYTYRDINFDAALTDLDFDPANPAYEFKRF